MPSVCSICKRRSADKLASVYWAWYPEPDRRDAFKVQYCRGDADMLSAAVAMGYHNEFNPRPADSDGCCNCGTAITDGVWLVTYAKVYIPKMEALDLELWSCEPCAIHLRSHVLEYGTRLPAREQSSVPIRARESPWGSLIPHSD